MPFLPIMAPRCLRIFDLQQVSQREAGIPAEYSFNAFWIKCACGNDAWRVLGDAVDGSDQLDDPLVIECGRCESRFELIDRRRAGYDGEIDPAGNDELRQPPQLWTCPYCASPGQLLAAVGYQYEPFESHTAEAQHAEDYFDAFLLKHRCRQGDRLVDIAALECA